MLAETCSQAAIPTLRFDYPGVGDSLGVPAQLASIDDLVESAMQAEALLRQSTGVNEVVFVGQGIGAAVATLAAAKAKAAGLVLLAPVLRGRDYLRELSLLGNTVAASIGVKSTGAAHSVAGFDLPKALGDSISALNFSEMNTPPAPKVLIAARPGRAAEMHFADRLRGLGVDTHITPYADYEDSLGNPTAARPPVSVIQSVTAWIAAQWPGGPPSQRTAHDVDAILRGDGFVERPVRIGNCRTIIGVLCEPAKPAGAATVLMVNAGGNPHTGWARTSVDHARALAASGVRSLRIDVSDVGDCAGPLTPEPVTLYADDQVQDVLNAVDWLVENGCGPVVTVGSCSGAYLAFNAALRSRSMQDLVLVNQQRFLWVRDGTVEVATEGVDHYKRRVRTPAKLLQRAFAGDIDWPAAGRNLARAAMTLFIGIWRGDQRSLARAAANGFRQLAALNVRISVIQTTVTRNHPILDHPKRRAWFGKAGFDLRYVPDADHAVTPPHARQAILEVVRDRALNPPVSAFGASAVLSDHIPSKRQQLSRWLGLRRGPEPAR